MNGLPYRKTYADPNIPPVTTLANTNDGQVLPLCEFSDMSLARSLVMLRDAAIATRSMKIAALLARENVPKYEERLVAHEFRELMRTTWRDFLIPQFVDYQREAIRRGIDWNMMTLEQEKRYVVQIEADIADMVSIGKAAMASHAPKFESTRAMRMVQV